MLINLSHVMGKFRGHTARDKGRESVVKGYTRSVNRLRSYQFYLAYVSLKGHAVA
jgi:hypothetical protein